MTLHLFNALYKNLCRPPNWERSRGFCFHFAIKPDVKNQKVVISLELFCPKYHKFFIPTRQMNLISKHFCLVDLISFDMV